MADPTRPPSSDEGEITDGDEDLGPQSPDYKPKSPAYKPPVRERDEEKSKKHHHHHHHKHHTREIEQTVENMTITISSSSSGQGALSDREALLRNKLLAKSKERTSSGSEAKEEKKTKEKTERPRIKAPTDDDEDDDVEHFQVQPKDAKNEKSKLASSDRDKGSKHERIVWRDRTPERPSGRGRTSDTRDRGRHESNKGGRDRHPDRRSDDKERERSGRKGESAFEKLRKREKEKEREKEKREKEKERKKSKRSRSRSPDLIDAKKTKGDLPSEEAKGKVEAASRSPSQEKKIDSPLQDPGTKAILATIRSTQLTLNHGPGYSKWQENDDEEGSEPEDDHGMLHNRSPGNSPPILRNSDEEMESVEEEDEEEEEDFDPTTVPFEELTDEQKAKLSPDLVKRLEKQWQQSLIDALPVYYAGILGCRNVNEFDCINKVEEGTFGVVYRAKCKRTEEVVALKRLKMEKERDGFPITSLREINMLLKAGNHENIVNVREIVIGHNIDKIFLVMEFVEHDLKSLMDTMKKRNKSFEVGHVKTLMQQLLSGLYHMHNLWILHRDLKTSNLLLTHNGILKIADFGLAREYGDPLEKYTEVVVTLWYRAPELLLGTKLYSTPIDVWSVGCIMAEFIRLKPLWPGSGEADQIRKIFMDLGTPIIDKWPEVVELPLWKQLNIEHFHFNQLRKKFESEMLNETAWKLLNSMLTYNPEKRMTCEEALKSPWFKEEPLPIPSSQFPTFPAKSEGGKAPPRKEPEAPRQGGAMAALDEQTRSLYASLKIPEKFAPPANTGFALKFDKDRF